MTDLEKEINSALADEKEPKKMTAKQKTEPKRVKIVVAEGNEEDDEVLVIHNGRAFQIQRGEEVSVPEYILEILDHAKIGKMVKVGTQADGRPKMEMREYPRYPYTLAR